MTTIAYDGVSIAIDGQVSMGSMIQSSNHNKWIDVDGVRYFCAGTIGDYSLLPPVHREPTKADLCGFFFKDGSVWFFSDSHGVWVISKAIPKTACGSGEMYARAAMEMGRSAKEAIELAAKLDIYTGGKISSFRVDSL